ncbi:hypothetical protein TNCV_2060881 [Trichonephila clavipes]|nr:hypothetical protein TNCV_2060881 [Trichonephila clavipes]
MCDSTFQLGCPKAITDSRTKFNYIIAHLPPEAATIIRDVIMNPDPVELYEKARTELIKRSGESSHQEIRKLLIGEELGDRRPSELLRVMRRRAESHSVPDDLMLELFLQHLPTRVQSILAAISPLTLEKAAEVADRVMEKISDITKPPRPDQEIKHSIVHYIETTSRPVTAKARRLAPDRLRITKAEFENMSTLGHMRPSKSNYASPLHMVPKKDSTEWRPVGDYRALNAQTIKDNYSVPNILDFTSNAHGTKIYSHIDLVKAYHQIPMNPDDVHKNEVLRNLPFVFAFVDDILVASSSPEEHLQHLQILFTRLQQYGLSLKPSKCIFGVTSIKFLGFKVSESGIEPLSDRVDCILNFPQPTTLTQLRRFLGLFNFYRRFVPKAAHLLAPLNKFLEGIKNFKKSKKVSYKNLHDSIQWTEEAEQAFNDAKNALADATLLRHPIPGAKLSLWTDASDKAVGGSLMQLCQNNWEPVAFLSVKLSKSQQKWSTYDRELLAMYISVKRFRHMLEGRDFIIYTDQKPLMYAFMQNPDKCSPRQWRHLDFISQHLCSKICPIPFLILSLVQNHHIAIQ